MAEIRGKKLTLENLRGFVVGAEHNGKVRIPSAWVLELIEQAAEAERLRDRLQISPQGDDKIDELEEAIENFKWQISILSQKKD